MNKYVEMALSLYWENKDYKTYLDYIKTEVIENAGND